MPEGDRTRLLACLGLLVLTALVVSSVAPYDRATWLMEVLLRGRYVAGRRMLALLSGCIALAVSAFYECIEWWAALALGQGADASLGTQGDPWDTQSDMFMALIGAVTTLLALARIQDRQIEMLTASEAGGTAAGAG